MEHKCFDDLNKEVDYSKSIAKFYQMIEMTWLDNADFTIKENR